MWPPDVERFAAFLRAAAIDARLEELAEGETDFPGPGVRTLAFECDGRLVVVLVPVDKRADPAKLACNVVRPAQPPPFPFRGADVRLERRLLTERTVWIRAGSPRHVAGMSPAQLARLLGATPADVSAEA